MEVIILGLLGFGAWKMTNDYIKPMTQGEKDASGAREYMHTDMALAGINWAQQRALDQHVTQLNSANVPYSAPTQKPTSNMNDILVDQADRNTFVQVYQPRFYFRDNTEMPLTSAAAGVYNVEIPGKSSILGDDTQSLSSFARAYIDFEGPRPYYFTGEQGTMGADGASEPSVWEEVNVPETGQMNYNFNPYGPGGVVQNLMNTGNEMVTRARGTNRSTIIGPPMFVN